MAVAPVVVDIGGGGWGLLLVANPDGSGEAKITWSAPASRAPDFAQAVTKPDLALESLLMSAEKLGCLSPLHLPPLVGLIVCQLTGKRP